MLKRSLLIAGLAFAAANFAGTRESLAEDAPVAHSAHLTVDSADDEWNDSGLTVAAGDMVLVEATGTMNLGGHGGKPSPSSCFDGKALPGALQMKLGKTSIIYAGARLVLPSQQTGALKFRILDSDYSDNHGSYDVLAWVIPAAIVSKAQTVNVDAANDEWESAGAVGADELFVALATGTVELGGWSNMTAGPDGRSKRTICDGPSSENGALEAKIGKQRFVIGNSSFSSGKVSGDVRFRVKDSKFTDNSGSFTVLVIRIKLADIVAGP